MSPSTPTATRSFPSRAVYDHDSDRLTIVVDALPAAVEDITVTASSKRVHLRIDCGERTFERSVTPPAPARVFTDDREAVYNNGVLTVSVGTSRRYRY